MVQKVEIMTIPLVNGSFRPSQKDINDTIIAVNAALALINGSDVTFAYLQATPALGTPSAIVLTNATGIASALNIGGNAATVTGLTVSSGKTLTANNDIILTGTDGISINLSNAKIHTIGFGVVMSGLTTGQQGAYVVCPVSGTITGWNIIANAGTATIETWKIASGTTAPTVANSISTAGVSLATGTAIQSTTITDFTTTTIIAGDMFAFNLSAVSGVTSLQFQLQITVT